MVHENITIQGISSCHIIAAWPGIVHLLEPAVNKHEYTLEQVREELKTGTMQLWIGARDNEPIAVMTTKIAVFPNSKIAYIMHVGGEFEDSFKHYLPRLFNWARANGASAIRMVGREGWKRSLKDYFENTNIVMEQIL